jgi:hypothetical protein
MNPVPSLVGTLLLAVPILVLTRAPYTPPGADDAVLRLSWRMNATAPENCRARTVAELDALPAHMRTPQECTRERADYVLVTTVGAAAPDTVHLVRGGVKGDRPVFVLQEHRLQPGLERVRVELKRVTAAGDSVVVALDTQVPLARGTVRLVTLDAEGRTLVVRAAD